MTLGTLGHLLLLTAFVFAVLSLVAYGQLARGRAQAQWQPLARTSWWVSLGTSTASAAILMVLFLTRRFEFAYVYSNSSLDLSTYYTVSAFWAGQEGSFFLWIVYTAIIGVFLIKTAREFEAPVMVVMALCQAFLLSMIVGLHLGPLSIGASPFKLLVEQFPNAPILQAGGVPPDGSGLNDLLKNWWMAIHPPTIFIGFASAIVPFAFAVAGLWQRKYTQWVRPALPWMLLSMFILGTGIAMGGYWAYETLSFGGYWAWDPVENSSLVPWLIGVAGIHAMIIQKKSGKGHKTALILAILTYAFVVYSTFLTRSGILGDISVHSFVDLGLYNQLLLWILAMCGLGFGLYAWRYRDLPSPKEDTLLFSREGLIFIGAMLLCMMGAVVILGTSAPIFGRIFRDNPSGVEIAFYNTWTLPLAIGMVLLAGMGQLFWWNKMNVTNVGQRLLKPLALSLVCTTLVLALTPFAPELLQRGLEARAEAQAFAQASLLGGWWDVYGTGASLALLLFGAFFAFWGNGFVLWRVARGNLRLAGGAISHIGFALTVIGLIASSAFSSPISDNIPIGGDAQARDNFVLLKGQTARVDGHAVTYVGKTMGEDGLTRYLLDITDRRGRRFEAKPVVYKSNKGQWIQHPDVKTYVETDYFVAVSPSVMFEENKADDRPGELLLAQGESAELDYGTYTLRFDGFDTAVDPELVPDDTNIAVAALVTLTEAATGETQSLRPIFVIRNGSTQPQFIQNRYPAWGIAVTMVGLQVDTGSAQLVVEGAEVTHEEDWVVVQAYEKPLISLLWFGVIVMMGGFVLSFARRWQDAQR